MPGKNHLVSRVITEAVAEVAAVEEVVEGEVVAAATMEISSVSFARRNIRHASSRVPSATHSSASLGAPWTTSVVHRKNVTEKEKGTLLDYYIFGSVF